MISKSDIAYPDSIKFLELSEVLHLQLEALTEYHRLTDKKFYWAKWIVLIIFVLGFAYVAVTINLVVFVIGYILSIGLICWLIIYLVFLRIKTARKFGIKKICWVPQSKIYREVRKILSQRKRLSQSECLTLWNNNYLYAETAEKISAIIIKNMGLSKNTQFYPQDKFMLMCYDCDDGMDCVDTIMAIEEAFSKVISYEISNQWFHDFSNVTFYDIVNFVNMDKMDNKS